MGWSEIPAPFCLEFLLDPASSPLPYPLHQRQRESRKQRKEGNTKKEPQAEAKTDARGTQRDQERRNSRERERRDSGGGKGEVGGEGWGGKSRLEMADLLRSEQPRSCRGEPASLAARLWPQCWAQHGVVAAGPGIWRSLLSPGPCA